jgi:hypothetical protein
MVTLVSSDAGSAAVTAAVSSRNHRYDCAQAVRAADEVLAAIAANDAHAPLPTLLFRLALSLRRCGHTAEADALFFQSSRMLAERSMNERLRRAS